MTIAIVVLSTAFVAAVVITVSIVLIIRQKKIKAEKNFEMELISREEKIRDASREGIGKIIYMRAKRLFKLTNLNKYYHY
jgi:hypothetical protein